MSTEKETKAQLGHKSRASAKRSSYKCPLCKAEKVTVSRVSQEAPWTAKCLGCDYEWEYVKLVRTYERGRDGKREEVLASDGTFTYSLGLVDKTLR